MSKFDVDYINLCKKILTEGVEVENRTGTNTIKIPSHHFHFDLSEEFENVTISSLFEITKEDAKSLFDNIISGFLLINRDIIIINPTHITKILSICINPLSECPSKFFV